MFLRIDTDRSRNFGSESQEQDLARHFQGVIELRPSSWVIDTYLEADNIGLIGHCQIKISTTLFLFL